MHGILYYSTISGNTRLVGEALQGIFANAGITLTLQDVAEDSSWKNLQTANYNLQSSEQNKKSSTLNFELGTLNFVLIACGTYGHGQLEKTMRKCCEETWKDVKINGIPCAAIGLGDHRYDQEYNMYAADQLEDWIHEHGGELLCTALRINRSPVKLNNQKIIENWAGLLIQNLNHEKK